MSNQILVPALGESVTEATVAKWLKQIGEEVDTDDPLVELETDKVNIEVPSPITGTLSSIKVKEGDTVKVGALLGLINKGKVSSIAKTKEEDQEQKFYVPPKTIKKKQTTKQVTKKSKKTSLKSQESLTLVDEVGEESTNGVLILDTLVDQNKVKIDNSLQTVEEKYVPPKTKKNLSPAVRKIVEEKKIDIKSVKGSGKDGRVLKGDLISQMGTNPEPNHRKIKYGD